MAIETKNINGFRFYDIEDQWYPSVTSVLSIIPNHYLEKWKKSLTEAQVQSVQEYTSHRGILTHFGCLKTYETETISQGELEQESVEFLHRHPQMKDEILIAARLFREFKQHYHLEPVRLEQCVWNEKYKFAGRLDFVGFLIDKDNGSKTKILMDIKTSKMVYEDSVSRQLSAYNYALNNWADKLYVLLLNCGKTTIAGVEIGADKPYWLFQEVPTDFHGFLARLDWFKISEERILAGEWKQ